MPIIRRDFGHAFRFERVKLFSGMNLYGQQHRNAPGILYEFDSIFRRDCLEFSLVDSGRNRHLIRNGGLVSCQKVGTDSFSGDDSVHAPATEPPAS